MSLLLLSHILKFYCIFWLHLSSCGSGSNKWNICWSNSVLFSPLTLINGACFLVFNLELLILLKTLHVGITWGLGWRSFPVEKASICYFRHQGAPPHMEHFKSLAGCFLWHNSVNLDCESIWGPACGYVGLGELIYLFSLNSVTDSKQASFLLSFFVWQDRLLFNSVVLYLCREALSCVLWTSVKESS